MTMIWLAVVGYLALQLAIGYWASRRVKTEKDYLLAGRSLGFWFVAFSLFATWFGSETVMGSSAAVAEEGLAGGRADPFGYALCLLGMALLLAYRLRAKGYVTIGDFFKERYGRPAEVVGSALFIPSILTWSGAQLLAFGIILKSLTGIDLYLGITLATVLVITYTTMGGLLGDVITDFLQGIVLILGLVLILTLIIWGAGGVGAALGAVESDRLSLVPEGESLWSRLDLWAIPILGSLVSQAALARLLAAKSPETARSGALGAFGLYITVGLIPVAIALIAPGLGLAVGEGDDFLTELARGVLPTWAYVIFMGALISALLSTVDSTLLTTASLVSHNILLPAMGEKAETRKLLINRAAVVVSGIVAFIIALTLELTILDLVTLADSIGTAGLLVVVLIGLYSTFGRAYAAFAAFAAGLLATPITDAIGLEAPYLASVAAALVAYTAGALLERRFAARPS